MIQVGYAMIVVALFWSDVAILHKFNNVALMTQYDNRAVALIEAGSLIGLYVHVCVYMYMYLHVCVYMYVHVCICTCM
jgi:hypothetical protein